MVHNQKHKELLKYWPDFLYEGELEDSDFTD